MDDNAYPKRPSHFANKYVRLLIKTAAAQQLGGNAFILCVVVAMQEDAKRYRGPVTFFTEQLLPLVGVAKWEALDAARKRAVAAGWLHYIPGNRGQRLPGKYWATVPEGLGVVNDLPCDESQYPEKGDREGDWTVTQYPEKGDREGDWNASQYPAKGDREGERQGDREGEHSILSPKPIKSTRKFVPPTVEEARAYWAEQNLKGNPEQFHDYYTGNGWRVGKSPMKDWQAAARNWSRNAATFDRAGAPTTEAEPTRRQFQRRAKS